MSPDFFKYPSTPHLCVLGQNMIRGDKVLSNDEYNEFMRDELVIEEKVDGANLGISVDRFGNIKAQNRGNYIEKPYNGQWVKLDEWIKPKTQQFFEVLGEQFILFGEWCFAKHSLYYDNLPDWFLGFDIYDQANARFLSCARRDFAFEKLGISSVPKFAKGHFAFNSLFGFLLKSKLCDSVPEGIFLRNDNGDWSRARAKLVRPEFIQSIGEHWSRMQITTNRMAKRPTNEQTRK